ncbi:carbohydrate binding protein [Curtobacterium sp. PhB130]|uniref:hypothetical protein n=1 Tax=Curtobacterium sp. PhB130 TaxID=2485178 RepID=UPI000F4CF34B|nr:hypothetical protein [Curtobacterium sp. PhB130]ROS74989.1 carbohydrate binding protein [Curtobacterium sp. PhB130]
MTIRTLTPTAVLNVGAAKYPLDVKTASITVDEGFSPYVSATLTIAHPGLTIMALIDPTPTPRRTVTLTAVQGGDASGTVTMTLNLTARQIVAESGEVGLNIANDEARLQDYSPASPQSLVASTYQASVRAIVNRVLTVALGVTTTATVVSGADVPFKAYADAQNLMPNGNFEVSSGQWTAVACTLAQVTTWKQTGTYSLRITPNSTATGSYASLALNLTPGQTYTMQAYLRVGVALTGTLNGDALKLQATATLSGATRIVARSNAGTNTLNTTSVLTMTWTVPALAESSTVRLINGATNSSANNLVYFDAVTIFEGDGTDTNGTALVYFDGDTPDTAEYRYDWDGDAGLSSSTRTALVQREADTLVWQPGTNAMEFLQPILQTVGLRLFQDIGGAWKLADNGYRDVSQQTRVAYGYNLYRATDLVSRTASQTDDLPLFADAVVLRYTWEDSITGATKTASDIAAPAGFTKPYVLELTDTPFPGAGRAAYLLGRLKARTRQLVVVGAIDVNARPGQDAVITTLDGGVQTGYVDAITWDLGADEMTVTTKALIAVTSGSIGNAPAGQTIGSVGPTTTIAGYTN